jgi:protein O-mannosyl-transferase
MSKQQKKKAPQPPRPKGGQEKTKKKLVTGGFFKRNALAVILFLVSFTVFINSIPNKYALDDEFYTAGANKLTQKGIKGIPKIFKTRAFFNSDGSGYAYRPVTLATFAIEIQFFGEDPYMSHFINVLLYAFTIVLLFSVLRRWFSTQGDWFSFFICLLFLVHPLHTEVVDNIKCRDEELAFFFALLSVLFVWKHHETGKWKYLAFTFVAFLASILSKRTSIPFFLVIPFAVWFFTDAKWKRVFMYAGVLIGAVVVSSAMQRMLLPGSSRTFQAFENPLPENHSFTELTATGFYVLGRYLQLHIFPHPLVYYYGYAYVPLVNWTNVISISSLVIHLALFVFAIRELRKKSILGFGIIFYLANIAIYSNLLQPAPGIMAERFAYTASLGFCIAVVWLLFRAFKIDPASFQWKSESAARLKTAFIILLVLFTLRCWWRNEDWEDKETLYGNDMEYLEESAKANMLLGSLNSSHALATRLEARQLMQSGDVRGGEAKMAEAQRIFLDARRYFAKATEVAPYYHTAWNNLGTTYFFIDSARQAIPYFKKAVEIRDDYVEGLFDLGMSYDTLRMQDSAIYYFQRTIKADSAYTPAYEMLAKIRVRNGNIDGAMGLMREAAANNPEAESPWNFIAGLYLQKGDTASAALATEKAAEINPGNLQRLYRLSEYYRLHGDWIKTNKYRAILQEQQKRQEKNSGRKR